VLRFEQKRRRLTIIIVVIVFAKQRLRDDDQPRDRVNGKERGWPRQAPVSDIHLICQRIIPSRQRAWLAERIDRIEVFYLPSYAPEFNPDERINADMERAISAKAPVRTKAKLKTVAEEDMTMIAASPERVRASFHDPRVRYAA
jgi:hypothetical protein